MVRILAIFALLITSNLAAHAEAPPDENMSVPAPATGEMFDQFARSFATPTHMTGKIARWDSGVCPLTVGQPPAFTGFVTKRVKEIAGMVGAPVDAASVCRPNIEIVFTTTPQALLDDVRLHQVDLLGYAETGSQRDKLATVTRPIQAWYATETRDSRGKTQIDSGRRRNEGATMACFTCLPSCAFCKGLSVPLLDLPEAMESVSGSSIRSGARSAFYHVIIVVDSTRLAGYEIGPLADYIALLALAQINALDGCQQLPSIINMLASGCSGKPREITENDLAYLRGLYRMSPEKSLVFQQGEIASQMKEALGR